MKIWIAESVFTRPLVAGIAHLSGAELADEPNDSTYIVTESARFAAWPKHKMHLEAGIAMQDRGVIAFASSVRADELEDPAIWVRTSSATAELVARATLKDYFGFTPSRWVAQGTGEEAGVVIDDVAALMPLESGFREDLTRAWFVLTGLPLVTHLLAVPGGAKAADMAEVAAWVQDGGRLELSELDAVIEGVVEEAGADRGQIAELFDSVRWTFAGEERIGAAELFIKSRVASSVGPIPWLTTRGFSAQSEI